MEFVNTHLRIALDERTGSLAAFEALRDAHEQLVKSAPRAHALTQRDAREALFTVRFLAPDGSPTEISALDAPRPQIVRATSASEQMVTLRFDYTIPQLSQSSKPALPLTVWAQARLPHDEPIVYWSLAVEHALEGQVIEWVDFPGVVVPNDLVATGGEGRLLWPGLEGALVEDAALRERTWLRYAPVGYPSRGWEGFYPSGCAAQFMAYYRSDIGLYLGAHDPRMQPKAIEFYRREAHKEAVKKAFDTDTSSSQIVDDLGATEATDGIRLQFRLFPGAVGPGRWRMDYEMALGVFMGDWHAAADIYRDWLQGSALPLPSKLAENPATPAWLEDSPLVTIYPVRGTHDTGEMTPNAYYPYAQALPTLDRLAGATGARLLALLMHWEGTAPWAPPYVWPPYGTGEQGGGEDGFTHFVDALHAQGHLAGVYGSSIGWTQESLLTPYDRREQFAHEGLYDAMCLAPDGELPYSAICAGAQRWGYDLCPDAPFTTEVAVDQISRIAATGCDYIQFFDQQAGGTSYFCYSPAHRHPRAPGEWQVEAMRALYRAATEALETMGSSALLGCEGAAAEPYLSALPLNDLRANMTFWFARPVPLYAYLYHEYLVNFMGNQVGVTQALDCAASPDNLLYRLAYAFVAGDLLAVTLNGAGELHWGWGASWEMTPPEQEAALRLLRTLTAWRRGAARDYLTRGRMERPLPLGEVNEVSLRRVDGTAIAWPLLLTSRWRLPDGRQAQVLVNTSRAEQRCVLEAGALLGVQARCVSGPRREGANQLILLDSALPLTLAPLSVLLVEWVDPA